MSRACSLALALAALLASVAFVHGEGAKEPRTDLYGDPLPPGAVMRLGTIRWNGQPKHGRPVEALAVSPDGKYVVSDADDALYLWDVTSGTSLRKWKGRDTRRHACLFSRDGKRLICLGWDDAVQVLDIATGKELRRIDVDISSWHDGVRFHALDLSNDGKRLTAVVLVESAGITAGRLYIWNVVTGKALRKAPYKLQEHIINRSRGRRQLRAFAPAALSPDAEVVSVWRDGRVALEEVATGRLLAVLPEDRGQPDQPWRKHISRAMLFSPDGRLVTAAIFPPNEHPRDLDHYKGVSLIEAATGEEVFRLEVGDIDHIAFSPDGRFLITVDKRSLRVWDVATGACLHQMAWPRSILDAHGEAKICSLLVLPDGRAVTGIEYGPQHLDPELLLPDGRARSGMVDQDIFIWDLPPSKRPTHEALANHDREKLDTIWSDLASDARKAHCASYLMAAAPNQAISFLAKRLQPAREVDAKYIHKLLADLDSDDFLRRESASRELAGLCDRIEPMLRRALRDRPSLEMRRRLEDILAKPRRPSAERLRTMRALSVLERIGTPEARRILEKLAGGAASPETRAAQQALQRLKYR